MPKKNWRRISGLTCWAFARAGSTAGSHDRAHTGSGSHAGHSNWTFDVHQDENGFSRDGVLTNNVPGCKFKALPFKCLLLFLCF